MTKKQFILEQIAPYYKDPSTCGYNRNIKMCTYYTEEGKTCVARKNLINPEDYKECTKGISHLIREYKEDILISESRGILTADEWQDLQFLHDAIAKGEKLTQCLSNLNITKEEIKAFSL